MLIGEVVKKTALSKDTIRFYEKMNLITVGRTDSEWNNYKEYSEETVKKLILIKKAKSFGFTLKEIAEILEMYEVNSATCEMMESKVDEKIDTIDQKIKELKELKKTITQRLEVAKENCTPSLEENCKGISDQK